MFSTSQRFFTLLLFLAGMLSASCSEKPVTEYQIEIVQTFPHDTTSYTQGLFFHQGKLCESTGMHGESTFRQDIDLASGIAKKKLSFDKRYFVEGSVVLGDELFILTWNEKRAFVYDAQTLNFKRSHRYPREGWGLTTNGKELIASDGSSRLYFMDTKFEVKRSIDVTLEGKKVQWLNELEWIDGKIWANIYTSDLIVIIEPSNGKVIGKINAHKLLPSSQRSPRTDVLNGIAYDGKHIYLTGKYWPSLFEIKLIKADSKR
jgi:glutamine cyclotransferase